MDPQDRILKLEEKIEKIGDNVSDVNVKVEKLITRLDIVLDQHGTSIKKHESDIQCLKHEMHERTWLKSKTSKILAFVSAMLLMILSNVLLNYIENKIEEKQQVTRVISNVSETPPHQNIYK
jgi:hypothetical protein